MEELIIGFVKPTDDQLIIDLHKNTFSSRYLFIAPDFQKYEKHQYFSIEKSALFQAILSNIFTFTGHKFKLTETNMLVFHFCNLPIKIKTEKIYLSKNRFFRLVDYKNSFRSSVTRG